MPKISNYSGDHDFTKNSDPKTWSWNHPIYIKQLGDMVLAADYKENGFVTYGIFAKPTSRFIDEKTVVSAMELQELPGKDFQLPVDKVAVVHTIATSESERGKGWAKILYEFILGKYKALFSDKELFTDKGKENKTVGIWKSFLPTLGKTFNYNQKTGQFSQFDLITGNDENIRFMVTSDTNIVNQLTESFGSWVKKGVSGAALTGMLTLPLMGIGGNKNADQKNISPPYPPAIEQDVDNTKTTSALAPVHKPIETPVIFDTNIDVDIIAQIESGGNTNARNKKSGARGLCQLKKAAWDESVKSLYGKKGITKYPYHTYVNNGQVNKTIADHYYNVVIPNHLNSFDLPVSKATVLASYNWGSTNVKRAMTRYGNSWLKHAPLETRNYIDQYSNIEKEN